MIDQSMSIYKQFYIYELQTLALAAAGTATDTINIDTSSEFHWVMANYEADIAAAAFTDSTRPIPNVTIQLTDTGSSRQFFQAAIPIPSIFGTGEQPFYLPIEQVFRPNSTIVCDFTNFDAAVAYNIRLALIGWKDFKPGAGPGWSNQGSGNMRG